MLEFTPRLRVTRNGEIVGFLTLPAHIGHVLPHVGEIVVLNSAEVDPDNLLDMSAAAAPKVLSAWHFVGTDPKPEYAVEIEVRTLASDEALQASLRNASSGQWMATTR